MNKRRHHYVPRFIAKEFTDRNNKLYFVMKEDKSKILCSSPKNLFVEKGYYDFYDGNGNRSVHAEYELEKIENKVAPIVNKIINDAENDRVPIINNTERAWWDLFLVCMWVRGPKERKDWEPFVASFNEHWQKEKRPYIKEEEDFFYTEKIHRSLSSHTINNIISDEELRKKILSAKRTIGVAVPAEKEDAFILGDFPMIHVGPSLGMDIANPEHEIIFPVHPRVAIVSGILYTGAFTELKHRGMCLMNKIIYMESVFGIASHSKDLLKIVSSTNNYLPPEIQRPSPRNLVYTPPQGSVNS